MARKGKNKTFSFKMGVGMHFVSYMSKIVDVTVRKQNLNHWLGDEDQLPAYKYVKNLESNLIR